MVADAETRFNQRVPERPAAGAQARAIPHPGLWSRSAARHPADRRIWADSNLKCNTCYRVRFAHAEHFTEAFVQHHRRVWPISVQCRVLGVSVAGYHEHVARRASSAPRRHLSNDALLVHSNEQVYFQPLRNG